MSEIKDTATADFDDSARQFARTLVQTVQTLPKLRVLPANLTEVMNMANGRISLMPSAPPKSTDSQPLLDTTIHPHLANHWEPPVWSEDELLAPPDLLEELINDARDVLSLSDYDEFCARLGEPDLENATPTNEPAQTTMGITTESATHAEASPATATTAQTEHRLVAATAPAQPKYSRHQRRRFNNKYKRAGMQLQQQHLQNQHQQQQLASQAQRCIPYVARHLGVQPYPTLDTTGTHPRVARPPAYNAHTE